MIPEISFFCPAYNDQENLFRLIPHVHKFLSEIARTFEIIIVEDGSPDKTGEVADFLATKYPEVRVIHHPKNMGYGGALRDGFMSAKYNYVMYTDGDFQYDVNEFKPVLSFLPEYDVLSGYAIKKAGATRRVIQSFVYNSLVKIIFGFNIKDANCSMKIYKKKVLDVIEIKSNSAFIDIEMLIKAKRKGFKIKQFPVTHYKREGGLPSGSKPAVIVDTIKDMIRFKLGLL